MLGQGSPHSESAPLAAALRPYVIGMLLLLTCAHAYADEQLNLRLQIAWGGSSPRLWRGVIDISDGRFSDMRLLGIDTDQAGSFINEGKKILVSPRYANRYSGLETTVVASADAVLRIVLIPDPNTSERGELSIPLASLAHEVKEKQLGEEHLLRVSRAAGDQIRVRFERDSMVYAPGERMRIGLHAHNMPVKAGTKGSEYRSLFASNCIPAIKKFKPQIILVSAGFDAHVEDDLAGLCLVDADYAWLAAEIKNLAEQFCDGKVAFTLEGGYNLSALAGSVSAVMKELIA